MLAELGFQIGAGGLVAALTYVVAATTIISGGAYIAIWGWRIAHIEAS